MSWYVEPNMIEREEAGAMIWSLSGDWTRDLPVHVREDALKALGREITGPLVLDLTNVAFIDSWAEELIADTTQNGRDLGREVALVVDASRGAAFDGVRHVFERRQLDIETFDQLEQALAKMGGAA